MPCPPGKKILILFIHILILLDACGRYKCHAIVIGVVSCFGPKFYKVKALYAEGGPVLVDPYPIYISYVLGTFGRLPEFGEIVQYELLLYPYYYSTNIS
jgi:hypothetical protein